MDDKKDPVTILRVAWSAIRLDVIRRVVDETIGSLRELSPQQVLGRELSALEQEAKPDPIREALETCCDELREECGMPLSIDGESRAKLGLQGAPDWAASYTNALDRYRSAAGLALQASLGEP